jgi:uncharacterized membrane protein
MQRIHLIAYLGTLVPFLVIDLLWIGVVALNFYRTQLGSLMLEQPKMGVALLFYALYCVGIVMFAVLPALRDGSWTQALLLGAAFGFFCYATYDLTNLATLRNWPVTMTFVDLAWGTVLTGTVATIAFFITRRFGG